MYKQKMIDAISQKGFAPIGYIADLDDIKTENGGKLCLGLECLDRDLWDFDLAFPLIQKLGIHKVRLQSGWQNLMAICLWCKIHPKSL